MVRFLHCADQQSPKYLLPLSKLVLAFAQAKISLVPNEPWRLGYSEASKVANRSKVTVSGGLHSCTDLWKVLSERTLVTI